MKTKLFLTAAMVLAPLAIFAQTVPSVPGLDLNTLFASVASLAAVVPVVIELIKRVVPLSGLPAQITSWVLGVVLALLGDVLNLGVFAETTTVETLAVGLGASLVANGVFDTGLVTQILNALGIKSTTTPKA